MPSMGEVAANSVPRAVAGAFQNAYDMAAQSFMGNIVTLGLKALQGTDLTNANPDMKGRVEKAGFIDPSKNPQNGQQRIVDAAIQGAVAAMLAPGGKGLMDVARSAVIGAASGVTGKTVEEFTRPMIGETAAHWLGVATGAIVPTVPLIKPALRAIKPMPHSELNTKTRMETFRAAHEEGLVVPPMSVRPSAGNQTLESLAGGGKLNIAINARNQKAATISAKKEIGLPPEAELVPDMFKALKKEAAGPYREVEQLGGSLMDMQTKQIYPAKNLLEQVQQKRSDAAAMWRTYANMEKPSPEVRELARAATNEAERFEDMIDHVAKSSNVPGLLNRVRGARQALAKIYDVETATNPGDGHVSLPVFGAMKEAGKPLSGRLDVLAKFWNAAKPVSREGASLGNTASGTDAMAAGLSGVTSGGSLLGMIPLAGPAIRNMARDRAMSPQVQRSLLDIGKLDIRPKAARGLSRAALIGSALHNTGEKESRE